MCALIRTRVALVVCFLALAIGILPPHVDAGDGGSFSVSQPVKKGQRRSGLQIDYHGWGWTGSGYREVQFEIRSVPTSTRQRTITIEVAPNSYYRGQVSLAVRKTVTLPKGHTKSTVPMVLPQYTTWHVMRVDVYEDDRRLDDVSMDSGNAGFQRNSSSGWLSEAYPMMLFIDADAPPMARRASRIADFKLLNVDSITHDLPDVRSLAVLVHPYYNQDESAQRVRQLLLDPKKGLKRGNDLENLEFVDQAPQLELMPPDDLPSSWLGLTQVDVVFISVDDLVSMLDRHPDKAERLLTYISTGATLVVHGLGEKHARLDELDAALARRFGDGESSGKRNWRELNGDSDPLQPESMEVFQQILGQIDQNAQGYTVLSNNVQVWQRTTTSNATGNFPLQPPNEPMFLRAPLGVGTVLAVAGDEPFHGRSNEWHWLFAQLGPDRWMWYRRHGLSLQRDNADYWNFLIPGFGAAPVNTFLLLITGFALVVGPVNYWFLRRSGRLYLLLATVPAAAAILTLGMLAYVVLHDGFSTRLRARSFTHLDQQRGRVVTWARQSYYSGVAPTGGMNFPADAAVLPIHHRPQPTLQRSRRLRWDDDDQQMTEGYHRSRTLTQLMVIRPQATSMKLEVRRRTETGELEVENKLGVPVKRLVISDEQGQLYQIENVATDARGVASPCTAEEVQQGLAPLIQATIPATPDKFDVDYHTRSFAFNWNYSWSMDSGFPEPTYSTSVLEASLRKLPPNNELAGRQFWAYTTTAPPSMPVGIKKVKEVASLHVIQGGW